MICEKQQVEKQQVLKCQNCNTGGSKNTGASDIERDGVKDKVSQAQVSMMQHGKIDIMLDSLIVFNLRG